MALLPVALAPPIAHVEAVLGPLVVGRLGLGAVAGARVAGAPGVAGEALGRVVDDVGRRARLLVELALEVGRPLAPVVGRCPAGVDPPREPDVDLLGVALGVLDGEDRQGADLAFADPGPIRRCAGDLAGLLGRGGPRGPARLGAGLAAGVLVRRAPLAAARRGGRGLGRGLDVAGLERPAAVRQGQALNRDLGQVGLEVGALVGAGPGVAELPAGDDLARLVERQHRAVLALDLPLDRALDPAEELEAVARAAPEGDPLEASLPDDLVAPLVQAALAVFEDLAAEVQALDLPEVGHGDRVEADLEVAGAVAFELRHAGKDTTSPGRAAPPLARGPQLAWEAVEVVQEVARDLALVAGPAQGPRDVIRQLAHVPGPVVVAEVLEDLRGCGAV